MEVTVKCELEVMKRNLIEQMSELETLQSVYPEELAVSNPKLLADINRFVSGDCGDDRVPLTLEYSLKVFSQKGNADLLVNLPSNYPEINKPEIYVRSSLLDRNEQMKLNEDLLKFLDELSNEKEPCIYSLVCWLQDHLDEYFERCVKQKNNSKTPAIIDNQKSDTWSRYWIYSHHIYSNVKRKTIADEARNSNLTGFCLAGKPGIICIEGISSDCESWWQKIKVMNWHKILLKVVETEGIDDGDGEEMRKFNVFQEISFPSSEKHNDMGQLFKYLTDHRSSHVFKEFFGVEGKLPS